MFSRDQGASTALIASSDELNQIDLKTGYSARRVVFPEPLGQYKVVTSVALGADGHSAATGHRDATVRWRDLEKSGKGFRTAPTDYGKIMAVDFSKDCKTLFAGSTSA